MKTQPQPIKFTIENKNGVQTQTPSGVIDVNMKVSLIRIISNNKHKDVEMVVKKCSVLAGEIKVGDYFSVANMPGDIIDIPFIPSIFITNTKDFVFELVENSKIEIKLYSAEN